MKSRRGLVVLTAMLSMVAAPAIAFAAVQLPSAPNAVSSGESNFELEGRGSVSVSDSVGGDASGAEIAKALEGESKRMLDGEYDFVAGYFLDNSGNLVARSYAGEANSDVTNNDGVKIAVLDSEYSREDIGFIHSKLGELAKAPGSGGFVAEYDARQDMFVITGQVDKAAAHQLLGDIKYSIVDDGPVERFSR